MAIGHMKTKQQFTFFLGWGGWGRVHWAICVLFCMENDQLAFGLQEEVEIKVAGPSSKLCNKHHIRLLMKRNSCRRVGEMGELQEALTDLKRGWIPPISAYLVLLTLHGPFHELKWPPPSPHLPPVLGRDEQYGKCLQCTLCLVSDYQSMKTLEITFHFWQVRKM